MFVSAVSAPNLLKNNIPMKNNTNLSFKGILTSWNLERSLKKQYGMECKFGMNNFVAESIYTTVKLFDDLFGRNSLPKIVEYTSFKKKFDEDKNVLGMHYAFSGDKDCVFFNSDNKCFKTKNKLKFNEMINRIVWWQSSGNYLHPFVHEFAHSAHYKHLCSRGNEDIMDELRKTRIPTALGRFITKFMLGRYAATNMNEFMAERLSKDVCNNLNSKDVYTGSLADLDYEYIFSKKWSYRYSCPQSYLDYYTQQVWNGDTDGANKVINDMERHLKKIEAEEALQSVQKAAQTSKQKHSLFSMLTESLLAVNKNLTRNLDNRNELRLGQGYGLEL